MYFLLCFYLADLKNSDINVFLTKLGIEIF